MKDSNHKPSLILLFAFISAAPINAVLYAPALPHLTNYFNITKNQSQFTIALFLLGYALSQLLFGPIANSFGRKKAAITSMTVGILGTILCIASGPLREFNFLVAGRLISGISLGATVTLTYTMINDAFEGVNARRITGYCVMSFAIAPGIANMIGGFLTAYLGWLSCFIFLLVFNIVILYYLLQIPETLPDSKKSPFNIKRISTGYYHAFRNSNVTVSGLIYGFAVAILYGIVAIMPFIALRDLGMTPSMFGLIFFLSYFGYILGTAISNRIAKKINSLTSVIIGLVIIFLGGVFLLIFSILNIITVVTLFPLIAVVMLGLPFVFINTSILGIACHSHDKANASSVIVFIGIFMAFITVMFLDYIRFNYNYTLSLGILFLSAVAIILYFYAYKKRVNLFFSSIEASSLPDK